MRVVVTSENHFVRGTDGFYTGDKYTYAHWTQLLGVFEEVTILARAREAAVPPGHGRLDGPGLDVLAAPDFVATAGLVGAVPGLARTAMAAARAGDAFILHAPGVMATVLREALRVVGKPYAIEVVGDPRESLRGSGRVLEMMRGLAGANLRAQVRGAAASRFVTRRALQERYPPRADTPSIVASDVGIPDELLDSAPLAITAEKRLRLGFVGMLDRPYKGLDVVLDALTLAAEPHSLEVAGDGALRAELEARAERLGLASRVRFHGFVPPGRGVYDLLRRCDLQVQPSRTEGLPRSLLEGMALGLPCLATPVGGIPELLEDGALVPVDDAPALARAIDRLAASPDQRRHLADANRLRAREYRASECTRRLRTFHEAVRATSHTRG